ncbi:MAG: hypothetical protein JEZ03_04540 [Bacteroidales bacterium]|nr:hypothetical protein [Bacteroidales bacterium]
MKRLVFILTLVLSISMVNAQKNKVQSASNYNKQGKYEKAKIAIDLATEHPKSMNEAKTWYVRGLVYLNISLSQDETVKSLSSNPEEIAVEAFNKASELDDKNMYMINITQNLSILSQQIFNIAVEDYKAKHYSAAIEGFDNAYAVGEKLNQVDTTSFYYAGLCAQFGLEKNLADTISEGTEEFKAKMLESYTKLIEWDYKSSSIYVGLSNLARDAGDTLKALEVIQKGRVAMPSDFTVLITETNLFLSLNKTNEALNNLKLALEADRENPTIQFAVGAQYDQMSSAAADSAEKRQYRDQALVAYKEAIALKPDYFSPIYNSGALLVNIAADYIEYANTLPMSQTKKYDAKIEEANAFLAEAQPFLETAHEMDPLDRNTMISLREIYTRLKVYDKLKDINTKLKELQ